MLRRIEIALDGTFHVQVIGGAGDFQVTFGFNSFGTTDIRISLIQTFLEISQLNILTFRADEFGSLLGSDHP